MMLILSTYTRLELIINGLNKIKLKKFKSSVGVCGALVTCKAINIIKNTTNE